MGINSRKSLHPRWVNHHTRTIDGFKNVSVRIVRVIDPTAPKTYNPSTRTYNVPFETIYEGEARIQPYGINLDLELANDPTARRLTLIQVAGKNLGIRTDDTVIVVDTDNIIELQAYTFDVRGSLGSSLQWGTNLVTEANLKVDA